MWTATLYLATDGAPGRDREAAYHIKATTKLGFTVATTIGGGDGWPVEPGLRIEIVSSKDWRELQPEVEKIAKGLKQIFRQQAVLMTRREEEGWLV